MEVQETQIWIGQEEEKELRTLTEKQKIFKRDRFRTKSKELV